MRQHLVCLLLALASRARAAKFSGVAKSDKGFVYLGNFAWGIQKTATPLACDRGADPVVDGVAQVTFTLKGVPSAGYFVYLYDDEDKETTGWSNVWKDHHPISDCAARGTYATCDGRIPVTPGTFTFTRTIRQVTRDRTWYIALAKQDCGPIDNIEYEVHFTNRDKDWMEEFGVNERGLNILYPAFMIAYCALYWTQYRSRKLYKHEHHLPKLLSGVLAAEWLSTVLFSFHFLTYMHDGIGHPLCRFFAEVAQAASKLIMALLLILVAQGWTIIRSEVENRDAIFYGLGSLGFLTLVVLVWGEYPASSQSEEDSSFLRWFERDAASTKYIYEESPGTILLLQQLFIGGWFLYTIRDTIKQAEQSASNQSQVQFFKQIAAGYGTYLLLVPLFCFTFANLLDPWVEEKLVRTIEMCILFAANAGMTWLIWPTRESNQFLQAGNFKKTSDTAAVHRAGLGESLVGGEVVGPDQASLIGGL